MIFIMSHILTALRKTVRRFGFDIHRADPFSELTAWVTNPEVIFDVGANVGQTVIAIRRRCQMAAIHAFEPSPSTFAILQRNLVRVRNVRLNNIALGAADGALNLLENTASDMSSFLSPGTTHWGETRTITKVPVSTVDAYAAKHGIERIGLLKIDTQGFDLEVAKGASSLIKNGRIDAVLTELSFIDLYAGGPRAQEVMTFWNDLGWSLVRFYDFARPQGLLGWCDALYVAPHVRQAVDTG
jgi:FkbM family methyltransferase